MQTWRRDAERSSLWAEGRVRIGQHHRPAVQLAEVEVAPGVALYVDVVKRLQLLLHRRHDVAVGTVCLIG